MSAVRLLGLCAVVCAVMGWLGALARAADVGEKKIGSLTLRDVTLMQAVTELTRLHDVRCIVPAQLQDRRVTVDLHDITAREALRAIVAAAECELVPLDPEGKVWTLRQGPAPAPLGLPAGAAAKPPVLHAGDKVLLPPWQVETVALAHDHKGDGGFSPPYLLVKLVAGASQRWHEGGPGGPAGMPSGRPAGGMYPGGQPPPSGEGTMAPLLDLGGGDYFSGFSGFWGGWRGDWQQTHVSATVDGKPWTSGPVLLRHDWSKAQGVLTLGFQIPPVERFDLHLTMAQDVVGPESRCRVAGTGTRAQPEVSFTLPADMGTGGVASTLRVVKIEDARMRTLGEIAELKTALAAKYSSTVLHNVVSSGGGAARPGARGAAGTEAEGSPAVSVMLEGNETAARAGLGLEGALLSESAGMGLTATRAVWRIVGSGLQENQEGPPLSMLLYFPLPKVPDSWVLQLDLRSPGDQPRQWTWEFKDLQIPPRAAPAARDAP